MNAIFIVLEVNWKVILRWLVSIFRDNFTFEMDPLCIIFAINANCSSGPLQTPGRDAANGYQDLDSLNMFPSRPERYFVSLLSGCTVNMMFLFRKVAFQLVKTVLLRYSKGT